MKIIYSGLESSGKSLRLAMRAQELLERNISWKKKYGFARTIASNMKFSQKFEDKAKFYGIPLVYWKDLDDLILFENTDVFIDEVGNYFDSRSWESLTLDVRRWLTQGAKCGVDIYGSAQDFAQVDKAFRRLCNELYHIRKLFGSGRPSQARPVIKTIWGICLVRRLDPHSYDEDDFKTIDIIPSFFFIRRQYTAIFDTNQKIVKSQLPSFKHLERKCNDCGFVKVVHQ